MTIKKENFHNVFTRILKRLKRKGLTIKEIMAVMRKTEEICPVVISKKENFKLDKFTKIIDNVVNNQLYLR